MEWWASQHISVLTGKIGEGTSRREHSQRTVKCQTFRLGHYCTYFAARLAFAVVVAACVCMHTCRIANPNSLDSATVCTGDM